MEDGDLNAFLLSSLPNSNPTATVSTVFNVISLIIKILKAIKFPLSLALSV